MKKILYISYDGITDPLGQSQILPYLVELSKKSFQFTILSFEKKHRFQREKQLIVSLINSSHIKWVPLRFSSKPPLISKIYDRWRLKRTARILFKKEKFDMIHCRSYVAAEAGLILKKRFGVKFLFDMRGFWADEKKDGTWNMNNPLFRGIYRYYKNKEAQYLQSADYIISLTEAGRNELMKWPSYNPSVPLEVIPTCVDMDLFTLTSQKQKTETRERLGIDNDALVISYLGSLGTWYMLNEMLLFFHHLKQKYNNAFFLILTHSNKSVVIDQLKGIKLNSNHFIIMEASRMDVPVLIKASDLNISFIKPVYSKISSSPTKLGEVLAMGIPVIANAGVGDVQAIIENANVGLVLKNFETSEYERIISMIPDLLKKDPDEIRNAIKNIYSLQKGVELYKSCYERVLY